MRSGENWLGVVVSVGLAVMAREGSLSSGVASRELGDVDFYESDDSLVYTIEIRR